MHQLNRLPAYPLECSSSSRAAVLPAAPAGRWHRSARLSELIGGTRNDSDEPPGDKASTALKRICRTGLRFWKKRDHAVNLVEQSFRPHKAPLARFVVRVLGT
jgi:hypothetical protein